MNRKRSFADIHKRELEKEKSLMDNLTEDQRVERRKLIAWRRSAKNARAHRKRTIADLRTKLKVATKNVKAAGAIMKMPSTPEVYRTLRDHGVAVHESRTNDRESMKGVFTFLKHKDFLHKTKGRYRYIVKHFDWSSKCS